MTHLFHLLERKSAIHFCHIVWSIVFLKALNWDFCRKNLRFGDPCQNRGRYVARCLRMVEWTQEVRQYFLEGEGWLIEHEDNDDSNDSWFMLSCVIFLVLLRSECFVKDFCHFWWGSYQYVRCPVCSFDFFDVVLVFERRKPSSTKPPSFSRRAPGPPLEFRRKEGLRKCYEMLRKKATH